MTEVFAVNIVCSDKGSHRPLKLQRFARIKNTWCEMVPNPRSYEAPGENYTHRSIGPGAHRIQCRRCRRDTALSPEKLAQVLDAVAAQQGDCLDLSHLPF